MNKHFVSLIGAAAMTVFAGTASAGNPAFDKTDYLGLQAISQGDYSGFALNAEGRPAPEAGQGLALDLTYKSLSDTVDISDYAFSLGYGAHLDYGGYDGYASVTAGVQGIASEYAYITSVGTHATDTKTEFGLLVKAGYEVDFDPVVAGVSLARGDVGDFGTTTTLTVDGRYALTDSIAVSGAYDIATGDVYDDNAIRAGVTVYPEWLQR